MITVMVGEHTIPSTATITLSGSDDNFATSPLSQVLPWVERNLFAIVDSPTYLRYRLTVSTPGSIQWLYISDTPLEPELAKGQFATQGQIIRELGDMIFNMTLPSVLQRQGLCVDVTHTLISKDSMRALTRMLKWAGERELGRFGIIPHDLHEECAVVVLRSLGDTRVSYKDEHGFQPDIEDDSAITTTLNLEAIP